MSETFYIAITFAPVQGFIEKSRKLRDLYGSSYLLSYLSQAICDAAGQKKYQVISPALPNIVQGMPNQIILKGNPDQTEANQSIEQYFQNSFTTAWQAILDTCRAWIEAEVKQSDGWQYTWKREWSLWGKYTWEFFIVQSAPNESITQVRQRLNDRKRSRSWTGINWQGESSTLSGGDAIARPGMCLNFNPKQGSQQQQNILAYFHNLTVQLRQQGILAATETIQTDTDEAKAFYKCLSLKLGKAFAEKVQLNVSPTKWQEYGEAFIDPREELSIPELIKRLITHIAIATDLSQHLKEETRVGFEKLIAEIKQDLSPESFTDLNRLPQKTASKPEQKVYWTGWFMGDGDGAGDYFKKLGAQGFQAEENGTTKFSELMRRWGDVLKQKTLDESRQIYVSQHLPEHNGRVIYAGGDDFLGVLYKPNAQLPPKTCIDWFTTFKSEIWDKLGQTPEHPQKPITVSVGFVWAGPKVPQREVLQHCRKAEKSAKTNGKDRIALRILFNDGQHLEWVCPWRFLPILKQYRDRRKGQNWTHLFNDIAVLESRHAFANDQSEVAKALFKIYFGKNNSTLDPENWWNSIETLENRTERPVGGILGERDRYPTEESKHKALNAWVINLAKVGFHLHRQDIDKAISQSQTTSPQAA
jgi:CRISPR-associated protein Cmr2